MCSPEQLFKSAVEKIFNNWTGLRLAVEHGMGGRQGHQTAIDVMNYMYDYCVGNPGLSKSEISETLEEIMDQEFDTILEDGSVPEISGHLLMFLELLKSGNHAEVEKALTRFPQSNHWLVPSARVAYVRDDSDSSSSGEEEEVGAQSSMDVDMPETSRKTNEAPEEECEPGWTTVKGRRKK